MTAAIQFGHPDEAKKVVTQIQSHLDAQEEEWHVIENLFNSERLEWADEAVFLKDEDGNVVSLALICKRNPYFLSYYTTPLYRRKGYGYMLLKAGLDRLSEMCADDVPIFIQPTSDSVVNHINKLPDELRSKLRVHYG